MKNPCHQQNWGSLSIELVTICRYEKPVMVDGTESRILHSMPTLLGKLIL